MAVLSPVCEVWHPIWFQAETMQASSRMWAFQTTMKRPFERCMLYCAPAMHVGAGIIGWLFSSLFAIGKCEIYRYYMIAVNLKFQCTKVEHGRAMIRGERNKKSALRKCFSASGPLFFMSCCLEVGGASSKRAAAAACRRQGDNATMWPFPVPLQLYMKLSTRAALESHSTCRSLA